MVEREGQTRGTAAGLETPLAVDQRRSQLDTARLPVVPNKTSPAVDAKVQPVIDLIRRTITTSADPEIRKLAYILTALEKLLASGGRVRFAQIGRASCRERV